MIGWLASGAIEVTFILNVCYGMAGFTAAAYLLYLPVAGKEKRTI